MCGDGGSRDPAFRTIPLSQAVNTVLAHDITEIRPGEFKGPAFRRGHVVREEDICHLQRLGKERLFVLDVPAGWVHEDEAATMLARALAGDGALPQGEPREGKVNLVAGIDGLLKVDVRALERYNMLGEVMCATLHDNTVVKAGQVVAATRPVPLVVRESLVEEAAGIAREAADGVVRVLGIRRPRAGVVITGTEVFEGRIRDSFAGIIAEKVKSYGGHVMRTVYAPDDANVIEGRLRELLSDGADLLVTTGGMSVDPDDVTRFAVRRLGADGMTYGSAALPGAMLMVAYAGEVPVIGVPACAVHHRATVFDLVLPRILAGERIGRAELAGLGHGGLCLSCEVCRYPICPFGK